MDKKQKQIRRVKMGGKEKERGIKAKVRKENERIQNQKKKFGTMDRRTNWRTEGPTGRHEKRKDTKTKQRKHRKPSERVTRMKSVGFGLRKLRLMNLNTQENEFMIARLLAPFIKHGRTTHMAGV